MNLRRYPLYAFLVIPFSFACAVPAHSSAKHGTAADSAKIDPKPLALLADAAKAARNVRGITAEFTELSPYYLGGQEVHTGLLRYLKPHFWRVDGVRTIKASSAKLRRDSDQTVSASDGKSDWISEGNGLYQQFSSNPPIHSDVCAFNITNGFLEDTEHAPEILHRQQQKRLLISLVYVGKKTWEGAQYQVVRWTSKCEVDFGAELTKKAPGGVVISKDLIYIGPDKLIHRVVGSLNIGMTSDSMIRRVKLNQPMSGNEFAFRPPAGSGSPKTPPLLAAGTAAPDFEAVTPSGRTVHLSDFKGAPVVLDFWATWCMPCQFSMPHLQQVYERTRGNEVVFLAVCVYDRKQAYAEWLATHKTYTFPTAFRSPGAGDTDAVGALYNVKGIPAQFVIDKDGKVTDSYAGYSGGDSRLEAALAKLGVEIAPPAVIAP